MEKVKVVILHPNFDKHKVGDVVAFDEDKAKSLVQRHMAKLHVEPEPEQEEEKPDKKPKGKSSK